MGISPEYSRELRGGEEGAAAALLDLAFGGQDESRLVERLRRDGVMAGEMVLPMQGAIVGYYAVSRMVRPKGWLCLAPVAVHPDMQRRRFGQRMVGMLGEWARMSVTPVVVLGQPAFYGRCGFSSEMAARLVSPYPVANTLVAGVTGAPPVETLVYPKAFGGL